MMAGETVVGAGRAAMSDEDHTRRSASLEPDPFARLLDLELLEVADGRARVALTTGQQHRNFLGLVHGGAVFSLADAALAAASNSQGDTAVATVVTIHLLRASHPGDRLLAEAVQEHRTGRLGLYRITVTRLPAAELVAIAQGQVTIISTDSPSQPGSA
jgi:acyl-CoA thioesterase